MVETDLEKIYRDAMVLTHLKEVVRLLHEGEETAASEIWDLQIPELERIGGQFDCLVEGAGNRMLRLVVQIEKQTKDPIAFADTVEEWLLPVLEAYMEAGGHLRIEEGDYVMESSASGYLSLYHTKSDRLIHGLSDPMEDARVMAESIYCPECGEYCILGAGLGYAAYQLYLVSGRSAKIRIYETDEKMYLYAERYGILNWIPSENLYIEKEADILSFLEYVDGHDVRYIIEKWVLFFLSEMEQAAIKNVHLSYNVERNIADAYYATNFWKNMERVKKWVSDIPRDHLHKNFVVVAAGPSLDHSMEFLMHSRENMTVIAVGTVFRKLLNKGVVPDFVTVLESHELVYEQFRGLEEQKVPLIMPLNGYWKIAERYHGEIFFFPCMGCRNSVRYARENGLKLWDERGTVSATAMEAAVYLGAKNVYLIGVDLAYPSGMSHAEDTPEREKKDTQHLKLVEQVGGGQVYSDYVFEFYRECMEGLIEKNKNVNFYNLSKEGARIKGTIEQGV